MKHVTTSYFQFTLNGILLALSLTVLDAVAHVFDGNDVLLILFLRQFAATIFMYMLLAMLLWSFIWLFMVKLGGVRPRIAFLFINMYFLLHCAFVVYLELFQKSFLQDLNEFRPIIAFGIAFPAMTVAALAALCIGKMSRKTNSDVTHALKTQRQWVVAILFLLLLVPLPWVLNLPGSNKAPETFTFKDHPTKHVFLITVDTLRQDVVSRFNPAGGLTKEMDRLASDGASFTNAFSPAPWTLPAIASIMTGLSPGVHRAIHYASALPKKTVTLAEIFSDNGYRTVAFGDNIFLTPRTNMDQGFHEYHWTPVPFLSADAFDVGLAHWIWALPLNLTTSTEKLTDNTIAWIEENKQDDFFLWLHYYDPHMPYAPPEEYLSEEYLNSGNPLYFMDMLRVRTGLRAMEREERDWIKSLYDGEVRYVDHEIGRLLDYIQNAGIYEDALIVLTSDHGEEFWDHGGWEHGHTLYNELIHVPLFIKPSGNQPSSIINTYVTTQSLPLTFLELCNVQPPTPNLMTESLTGLIDDPALTPPVENIYSGYLLYYQHLESVLFGEKKLIHDINSKSHQFFDLVNDPKEIAPLVGLEDNTLDNGFNLLDKEKKDNESIRKSIGINESASPTLNERDIQTLEAVGYL